jgi:nucleoside-diphosphate-sugar epimerase
MRSVLLTGAGGFIGRHCVQPLLAAGFEVHAVSSKQRADGESPTGVSWHRADLFDAAQVSELIARVRPTHLLHLAWHAVPGEYWTSPENFRWVSASLGLVREFARAGGRRAVVAGTCAEYDWRYGYCSEGLTPLSPASPYAACKHALHLMLGAMARQDGFELAWGRVFFLYGPHERPERLVASVIRSVLRGEEARCSHGRQVRDYVHVEDAAGAFAALLASSVRGAVNVASGRPATVGEIVGKVAERLGRADLLRLGALATAADEPRVILADTRRLNEEVGWSPRYDLERGLDDTINWWRLGEAAGRAGH